MVFLETDRLLFRSHEDSDEPSFVRMQTDPLVRQYVGGSPWEAERAKARFRSEYLGQPVSPDGLWATILKSDGVYVGHCGICARESPTEMRLAYYLAQPYWNHGYATEAAGAFSAYAFNHLPLDRLVAEVRSDHAASVRVLEKVGFRHHASQEIRGRIYSSFELKRANRAK